jgi:hypothetical protein
MKSIIVILPLLILAGCQTDQPATTVDLAPLSTQIGNLSEANSDLKVANERLKAANDALTAENARLLSMLRADADAGQSANLKGWLPFERYVWGHQLALLPDIIPDKTTADRWSEASTLYAEGGESAMQGVINTLNADAKKTNETLGTLREQVAAMTKERDEAQDTSEKALQQAEEATANLKAAVAKAKADEASQLAAETRAWEVKLVLWMGEILFVAAIALAACCFLLPVAVAIFKKAAFVAGIGCAACFAFARFLSSPWFDYAWKATAGALAVAAIGWAAWELRQAIKRSKAAEKAADNAMVAEKIIPVLDNYYKHVASPEAIKDMDKPGGLWDTLDDLGGSYDAAVKRIKAEQAENPVEQIKASIALAKPGASS